MFTLRCTKKLLIHLKVKPDPQPPPSTTKLGDRYADVPDVSMLAAVLSVRRFFYERWMVRWLSLSSVMRVLLVVPMALALAGCKYVYWVTPTGEGRAAIDAPSPETAPRGQPRAESLHETRRWDCLAAASTGNNFCELRGVTPLSDGRALAFGAFRGKVRVGTQVIRSRGMQNALVMMLEPDGSIAWVRQYGEQWHNAIGRVVQLSDGRFAVAGIAANGFHPTLSIRPTAPDAGFNAERPFVGVLTEKGEWAWIRDWPDLVADLHPESERFVVLDAARWTRLGGDGSVMASRALAALPARSILIENGAWVGGNDCAWQLFGLWAYTGKPFSLFVRSTCGSTTSDWPLAELASPQSPLGVATSPDGQSLYVVAGETPSPQTDESSRGWIRQTLWRVDARKGVRFAVRTWPSENGARLGEERSAPLALVARDDTVDLIVGYRFSAAVAGIELPAATVPSGNGIPRAAVTLRFATSDGFLLKVFTPPPVLGRDLEVNLLSDRPVFALASNARGDRWLRGTVPASDGGIEVEHVSIMELEDGPMVPAAR